MGTNYYLRKNYCHCCKRYDEIHIGKSSVGTKFLFHVTNEIRSIDDWFKEINKIDGVIVDEYGQEQDFVEFKEFISQKSTERSQKDTYFKNDIIFWTDGDYDYLEGEFS